MTDFAPYAGNYTFTITANNRSTSSRVLAFTSPVEIPYPIDGTGGLDRHIELGGNTYDANNAYISGTTPTFKWKPYLGDSYHYRLRVFDLKRVRCWFQEGPTPGTQTTGGYMSATVPQGMLQPNTPYQYEIEVLDTPDIWTAHNRSRSTASNFYTGTKGSDFLFNPYVFHFQSFNAGDRAVFGVNVFNLAPWDIVSGVMGFRVERSGTT